MQARPLLCLSSDFMSSVCVFVLCIFSFYAYFLSIIINVPYIYVTVLYLRVPPKRALTKVEVWDQLGAGVLLQSKLFLELVKTKFTQSQISPQVPQCEYKDCEFWVPYG